MDKATARGLSQATSRTPGIHFWKNCVGGRPNALPSVRLMRIHEVEGWPAIGFSAEFRWPSIAAHSELNSYKDLIALQVPSNRRIELVK